MRRLIPFALSLAGLVLFGLLLGRGAPAAAAGPTPECGVLGSATWTLAGSPYVVCDAGVTVPATATLAIQPGVQVNFTATVGSRLNVIGRLNALGSATQPITFTRGPAVVGDWGAIAIDSGGPTPALASLSDIRVDYGGAGSTKADIYVDHGVLTLTDSLVDLSVMNGLVGTTHALVNVSATRFMSNTQDAAQLNDPTSDISLSGLTASGNGLNAVHIQGLNTHIAGAHHWANPGLPYVIDTLIGNAYGDVLTIDPGSDLRFGANDGLGIGGELIANGTPSQPITFTAESRTPGQWRGLQIFGSSAVNPAAAQLDYATVEYGGSDIQGADIEVDNGRLNVHHSVIRQSSQTGVKFDSGAGGSILNSQIISNSQVVTTTYSVLNGSPTRPVLATNDWWGDPAGPQSDVPGCSTGHGGRVSTGVIFQPVLTSTNTSAEFPLSAAPQITLTPRRLFAPADGTKIYFDITLLDGNGHPLPGRTVRLNTSFGSKTDGGVTDVNGHTLAYLVSNSAGDASVSATLDALTGCEAALSPDAKVTFTTPASFTDLFPDSPAPYVAGGITVLPQPVVVGITETIRAKLTNPLTVPVTVDVDFSFAQASVGLAFGPIKSIVGQVIPPNSSVEVSADFRVVVAGHYCVQVAYDITSAGATRMEAPADNREVRQYNLDAQPGPTTPSRGKDALNKADKSLKIIKKLPGGPGAGPIQKGMFDGWWDWTKDTAEKISQALGLDPPRQDYTVISVPVSTTWPAVQPSGSIPAERAAAINAVSDALVNVVAYGQAASIALDRYGGASAAGDLTWEAQQANAQQYYQQQMGAALLIYADRLDAFVQLLQTEGVTGTQITVSDVISYQQRLNSAALTGFTSQEIADAHQAGLSDADLLDYKLELLAANPSDIAGNLLDIYTNEAATDRELGNALLHPYNYNPGFSVSGSAGQQPAAAVGNSMVQLYNTSTTIQVSNSLTATMNLLPRRIDLPADWAVTVSPSQVAPGAQVTVTVTILAGSPVPQGSQPRAVVEGYVGSTLIGGVVVAVAAPYYALFDGHLREYLPVIRR